MKLEDINALAELDRNELITKALELGVRLNPDVSAKSFPTSDGLRLAIIDKVVEHELALRAGGGVYTAHEQAAQHMAEATLVHAHGVELHREGLQLLEKDALPQRMQGERRMKEADAHFACARSAAAIAQAGFIVSAAAGIEDRLSDVRQGMN